jgi:putative addiction module component (TIGR02574 family)
MADPARVLEDALTLTTPERARLARELLRSLDDAAADDATAAWTDEIRARIDDVEAGRPELEDWDVVRARLETIRGA